MPQQPQQPDEPDDRNPEDPVELTDEEWTDLYGGMDDFDDHLDHDYSMND